MTQETTKISRGELRKTMTPEETKQLDALVLREQRSRALLNTALITFAAEAAQHWSNRDEEDDHEAYDRFVSVMLRSGPGRFMAFMHDVQAFQAAQQAHIEAVRQLDRFWILAEVRAS